jgi:hypothetical protein
VPGIHARSTSPPLLKPANEGHQEASAATVACRLAFEQMVTMHLGDWYIDKYLINRAGGIVMTVYSLKKKGNTGESHLFDATESTTTLGNCTPAMNSVCRKMKKTESTDNIFTCLKEAAARTACAAQGRAVCGICVSHLYTTYP